MVEAGRGDDASVGAAYPLRAALATLEDVLGSHSFELALAYGELAAVLAREGAMEESLAYSRRARAIVLATG